MARITEATRELLRKKILEKSQDKRDALAGEIQKLSECLDAETQKVRVKAIARIKEEFDNFNKNVANILRSHGLKFGVSYSTCPYSVESIIGSRNDGEAYIMSDSADKLVRVKDSKDPAVRRLDNLRDDLKELDDKRKRACEDIELRVALGAKFDEVVELINNLQF